MTTVAAARHNGSMYAHVFVLPTTSKTTSSPDWVNSRSVPLTKYEVPQASTFQLVGDSAESKVRLMNMSLCVSARRPAAVSVHIYMMFLL